MRVASLVCFGVGVVLFLGVRAAPTPAQAAVAFRSCGVIRLSGMNAKVRTYGTGGLAPLGCLATRRVLRRFIARRKQDARVDGWNCHATSVQGAESGYPPDNAWCQRHGREISARTPLYGE